MPLGWVCTLHTNYKIVHIQGSQYRHIDGTAFVENRMECLSPREPKPSGGLVALGAGATLVFEAATATASAADCVAAPVATGAHTSKGDVVAQHTAVTKPVVVFLHATSYTNSPKPHCDMSHAVGHPLGCSMSPPQAHGWG